MAKKASKSAKKQKKSKFTGATMLDKLPKNRAEWLERCIFYTKRAAKKFPHDTGLQDQLDRLNRALADCFKHIG
jgi:hypothetical protein